MTSLRARGSEFNLFTSLSSLVALLGAISADQIISGSKPSQTRSLTRYSRERNSSSDDDDDALMPDEDVAVHHQPATSSFADPSQTSLRYSNPIYKELLLLLLCSG